jgi:hypothetical protein
MSLLVPLLEFNQIYGWVPYLNTLRSIDPMWVSAVVVGVMCFFVVSVIARFVVDRAPHDKVERRLRKRGLERKKRELGGNGFEVE